MTESRVCHAKKPRQLWSIGLMKGFQQCQLIIRPTVKEGYSGNELEEAESPKTSKEAF